MARTKNKKNHTTAYLGFEVKFWTAADTLRNNTDAVEHKHVDFGLISGELRIKVAGRFLESTI
jgi:hypothetical protein